MEPTIKLLIVDDDEVDRMIIARSLRSAKLNAEVHTATMGAEALKATGQQAFDFIFIDFMLPDMNGLELLQKLREKDITTPVQIVTSQGDERLAVEAIKTGASDYLPKTLLTPEGISQSIRSAVRLHKIEQERQNAKEQLKRTQEQLETVISGAPIILWAVDKYGIVTMSRGKGLGLIGKVDSESVGHSVFELYQNQPYFLSCIKRSLTGKDSKCTLQIGDTWFDTLFLPMQNKNEGIEGVIGVSYDITERVKSEQELKKAKDEALNMAQVKEQFLANMSHEIRTPMNGILGLTEVLAKTNLNDHQRDYLKAISTSANNLMVIINDLLDFSKIEAGKISLEIIPFELRQLIKQLLDILEIRARERRNVLKLLLDDDIPQYVIGDPFRLSQILNNLLGNAIKFTEGGTIKLSVEVLSVVEDIYDLEFTVKDTGIGIPEEKLGRIFDKFTQGSSDTTRRFGGTGLGLSIAKELVEVQGGHISVESKEGHGSTFQFNLPYRKIDNKPQAPQPSEAPAAEQQFQHLKNAKILLAEDNPINQMLVKKVLGDQEIKLQVANNGKEALDLLDTQDFDLILMDMQMPEMDGYEAMQHIRARENSHRDLPIIALTAHASQGEANKCITSGANSYVSKPFQAETLLKEISKYLTPEKMVGKTGTEGAETHLQVDMGYLEQFANGNVEFMLDILKMFVEQIPGQAQQLTRVVSFSNWTETRTIAHKIKPSLALVGLRQIEDLNNEIEQNALHRTNTEQIPSLVQKMVSLVNQAVVELQKEMKVLEQKIK